MNLFVFNMATSPSHSPTHSYYLSSTVPRVYVLSLIHIVRYQSCQVAECCSINNHYYFIVEERRLLPPTIVNKYLINDNTKIVINHYLKDRQMMNTTPKVFYTIESFSGHVARSGYINHWPGFGMNQVFLGQLKAHTSTNTRTGAHTQRWRDREVAQGSKDLNSWTHTHTHRHDNNTQDS